MADRTESERRRSISVLIAVMAILAILAWWLWGPETSFLEEPTVSVQVSPIPGSEPEKSGFEGAPPDELDSVSETPAASTEAPAIPSEAPASPSETPAAPSEAPATPSEAPVAPSEAPAIRSEAPAIRSEAPATPSEAPASPSETPAAPSEAPATPSEAPASPSEPPVPTTEALAPPAEESGPPLIDVVRVDAEGNSLVAGQAEPGSTVIVLLDDEEVARTEVGSDGSFATMLEFPLAQTQRLVSLVMEMEGREPVKSDTIVIIAPIRAEGAAEPVPSDIPALTQSDAERDQTENAEPEPVDIASSAPASQQAEEEGQEVAAVPEQSGPELTGVGAPGDGEDISVEPALRKPDVESGIGEIALAPGMQDGLSGTREDIPGRIGLPVSEKPALGGTEMLRMESDVPAEIALNGGNADTPLESSSSLNQWEGPPQVAPPVQDSGVQIGVREASPAEISAPEAERAADVIADIGSTGPGNDTSLDVTLNMPEDAGRTGMVPPVQSEDAAVRAAPRVEDVGEPPLARLSERDQAPPAVLLADDHGIRVLQPGGDGSQEVRAVAVDTISYDEVGDVQLGGRGTGSRFVRIYLDNRPIETVQIGEDGQWRAPLVDVESGIFALRVDELDWDGQVTSRMEIPFKREDREALAELHSQDAGKKGLKVRVITVQRGNTLWGIARDRYGEGILYVRVFEANRARIRDPDLIYPGQIFALPE